MKETIRYGFVLGLICFLASGVLAVVNGLTEPKIELNKVEKEEAALKEVLPKAIKFIANKEEGGADYYLAYDEKNSLVGVAIKSSSKGYSSIIESLAGLDKNLEIVSIKILSQNETPGLGSRVSEESFLSQFIGKKLDSLWQVQAITGATISSTAVINSVNNKIEELAGVLLKEFNSAR